MMYLPKKKSRKFYILTQEEGKRYPLLKNAPEGLDEIDFINGKPVRTIHSPVLVDLLVEDPLFRPDLFVSSFPFFSDRLKKTLDGSGVLNIEYFPAVFSDERSLNMETGYWLANILSLIEGISESESDILQRPGRSRAVINGGFKINEARIHDERIFRLEEDRSMIIVSEELQEILAKEKLEGARLICTESYRPAGRKADEAENED